MAAEFVLTFAAEGILTKVSSLAVQELSLAWGFKAELRKLAASLSIIQDFLRGAADQKREDQGKGVEDWVNRLKAVAEYADDVLDEFSYEFLRRKVELQNHMKRKVLDFLSASNPLLFRLKMAHKIKKINDSLVELKNDASWGGVSKPGGEGARERDQTDSFFEKDEIVVGREDDAKNIVETLINSNNQKDHSVMAIVGMPGLGKTTLAKKVFNETAIDAHFHKKIWVCVSNSFEVDMILSQMLDSLNDHNAGSRNRDALIRSLREQLEEKKYVLVLDDVWSEERSKWESLMSCLSKLNSTPGSSIIITTRSANVASIAETLPRPTLRNLSNEECWSILKQRAEVNNEIDADRERIGMAIAEKCGGVPLVAKVLGSIMRSKTSRDEWLAIQNSEIWELTKEEDRIMSVLKLSFDHLKSSSLKQCFSYCSLLKKDFEIERDTLIQLWMAQGLLQPSSDQGHHEMEDTGNEYFNILLNNSLFQEVTTGGSITKYTMHDLVHDLAEEVSKCESLTRDLNHTCEVRHVARIPRRLHSLFSDDHVPDIILSKFRALRVLNLQYASIQELSNSIGKLKHLRYLDVSYTRIEALPKSIGRLYNLQTLRMQGTRHLKELPREMQNLINLRHLYFDEKVECPAGMFKGLTNLQTMHYFNVGKQMGVGIVELAGLNQLKGNVTIGNLENVMDEEDAKKAKLEDKKNIQELSFVWTKRGEDVQEGLDDENVLEGLQPHPNLKSLAINNFMGDRFPSWMMRKPFPLNNLQKLLLDGCLKCEGLPILGHLPSLTYVKISGMKNLKCLGSEFYGYDHVTGENDTKVLFPALKTLSIEECGELTEWREAPTTRKVVVFPCLEGLYVRDCPLLRDAPSHFPSLKYLDISGMGTEKPMASICNEVSTLTSLDVSGIKGLTLLPSGMLKKNKNLTSLSIYYCDEMIRISANVFGCCSNLKELIIWHCEKLEHLAEGLDTLPLLEKLTISGCPKLQFIPIDHDMASLRQLDIRECDGLSSIGLLDHCTALQQLTIWSCRNLTSIPISEGLASLCKLEIGLCDGLTGLPSGIENCTSLEELHIEDCSSLATISFTDVKISGMENLKCLDLDTLPLLEKLTIIGCPKLQFIPIDHDMASLQELRIKKCDGLSSIGLLNRCTALQQLKIKYCDGLSSIGLLDRCTALQQLEIRSCRNLTSIPISEGLASLRKLRIWACDGLTGLPSGIENCTSLEELIIGECSSLATISFTRVLPSLQELVIGECSSLATISFTRVLPSLQKLSVSRCPKLASISCSTDFNPRLDELSIRECNGLQAIPDFRTFTSLRVLRISDCAGIESLVCGFHFPLSLQDLEISCFHNLESFPSFDKCASLGSLSLGPFREELDSFPDFQVPSQQLTILELYGWPKLKSLPQQAQHFRSLAFLRIESFNGVDVLPEWLGNLASLEFLFICDCANLKYLPSLKAMERLTKLYSLSIGSCPLLKERCTKDSGEEWPKISHIPEIDLW